MGIKEKALIKQVYSFSQNLAKTYGLKRVYLFGSLAEGLFFKGSDIDIAIEGMDFANYLKALAEYNYIKNIHLDILSLEFCPPELKEVILEKGKLIYEKK